MPRVRVMVVDDHPLVRRGFRALVAAVGSIELCAEAADGRAAIEELRALEERGQLPDVVLLDLLMPGLDGTATTAEIRRRFGDVPVVILTGFGELERLGSALAEGATGFLFKDAAPAQVLAALHAGARGETVLHPGLTRRLAAAVLARPATPARALTEQQRALLALLARDRTDRGIARELGISEPTAALRVSDLLDELALRSRTQAALLAVALGLPDPGARAPI